MGFRVNSVDKVNGEMQTIEVDSSLPAYPVEGYYCYQYIAYAPMIGSISNNLVN